IPVFERERFHIRAHRYARRESHELFAVAAREIGDRADGALFPEDGVGKRGDVAHVNATADDDAALADGFESLRYERADGRKYNRGVKFLRRQFIRSAGPHCAEMPSKYLRFFV